MIETNLAIVEQHMANEAHDPDSVLELYTDDIVQEFPNRDFVLRGKDNIAANYKATFSSMENVQLEPLDRFATSDRVVDDMIVRFRLVGDGLVNVPVLIGSDVVLRLVHVFHMKDGLIAREIVHEHYTAIQDCARSGR